MDLNNLNCYRLLCFLNVHINKYLKKGMCKGRRYMWEKLYFLFSFSMNLKLL